VHSSEPPCLRWIVSTHRKNSHKNSRRWNRLRQKRKRLRLLVKVFESRTARTGARLQWVRRLRHSSAARNAHRVLEANQQSTTAHGGGFTMGVSITKGQTSPSDHRSSRLQEMSWNDIQRPGAYLICGSGDLDNDYFVNF
jgi:hypothetical protein